MLLSRGCFCYVIGGGLKLAAYHPCLPNCQAAPRSRASFLEKAANQSEEWGCALPVEGGFGESWCLWLYQGNCVCMGVHQSKDNGEEK